MQLFSDSTGENAAALDGANVFVGNDADVVALGISWAATPSSRDARVLVDLDTDRNRTTGDVEGSEERIEVDLRDGRGYVDHWAADRFVRDWELPVDVEPGGILILAFRNQLRDPTAFDFAVRTLGGSEDAPIVDQAPDAGKPRWRYELVLRPVIDSVAAHPTPRRPRAGKASAIAYDLDVGRATVKPTTAFCAATLGGRTLRSARAGGCRWRVPASATGKRLVVRATVTYRDAKPAVATASFRVE